MVRFITGSLDVLSEYQKIAIDSLIAIKKSKGQLNSIRSTQDEILRIYNEIKRNLGTILLSPRAAVPGEKISSEDHNYNMETIFLDLNVLYGAIDKLGKSFDLQSVALDSSYEKSKASIQKLINDVKVLSLRKKYQEFTEIKVIDFNYSSNKTDFSPKAYIDPATRLLQLNTIVDKKLQLENRENKFTRIYTKTISPGLKANFTKAFPVESIVDKKPETFWTTFIMADGPVKQKYSIQSSNGASSVIDVNGPVVEVYFKFSGSEKINYIRLLPFASFPIKILDISYKQSNQTRFYKTINDFTQSSTTDWEEYNFSPIYAVEIKITIAQENGSVVYYQVPEGLYYNSDIFQRIYTAKLQDLVGASIPDSDLVVESERLGTIYTDAINSLQSAFSTSLNNYDSKNKLEYYYNFNQIITDLLAKYYPDVDKETIFGNYTREDLNRLQLIQVRKHEYLLGLREVEIGYAMYSPVGKFSSDKFLPQASIASVALEVDERHPEFVTDWQSDYRKTSTEWDIDLGDGRIIPIHPRNVVGEGGYPLSKDEVVRFSQSDRTATTRLGGRFSFVHSLKKNGQVIPETEYTVSKVTGATPYLNIYLTGYNWFDPNSLYTVDYFVDNSSCSVQVLGKFSSKALLTPELFTGSGPNNEIELSKFPYVDYAVINYTDLFYASGVNEWTYYPPVENQFSGQVLIYPTILNSLGDIIQTGSNRLFTISGIWGPQTGFSYLRLSGNSALPTGYFSSISGRSFGYYLQVMDSLTLNQISGFTGSTGALLYNPIEVTVSQIRNWAATSASFTNVSGFQAFSGIFSGEDSASGWLRLNYSLGVGVQTDNKIYGLNNNSYIPLTVEIEGKKVTNITNYETLLHPAFSVSANVGSEYEYIQAGKNIYFNEPVTQEIKVTYNWLTDYIQLQGTLRCNTPINPDLTPKVNEARLLINTTII
jgi:hypothetical protein